MVGLSCPNSFPWLNLMAVNKQPHGSTLRIPGRKLPFGFPKPPFHACFYLVIASLTAQHPSLRHACPRWPGPECTQAPLYWSDAIRRAWPAPHGETEAREARVARPRAETGLPCGRSKDRVAFVKDKSYLGGFLINIAVIRAFFFPDFQRPNPERLL